MQALGDHLQYSTVLLVGREERGLIRETLAFLSRPTTKNDGCIILQTVELQSATHRKSQTLLGQALWRINIPVSSWPNLGPSYPIWIHLAYKLSSLTFSWPHLQWLAQFWLIFEVLFTKNTFFQVLARLDTEVEKRQDHNRETRSQYAL